MLQASIKGLRTLFIAMRELSESQLKRFLDMYKEADLLISDRQSRTDKVTELLESDLTLLGATAVEDKLQDQV